VEAAKSNELDSELRAQGLADVADNIRYCSGKNISGWLQMLPCSANGDPLVISGEHWLQPSEFLTVVLFRLSLQLTADDHLCALCRLQIADKFGDHSLRCMHAGERTRLSDCVCKAIATVARLCGFSATEQAMPFTSEPTARVDLLLSRGQFCVAVDVAVTHALRHDPSSYEHQKFIRYGRAIALEQVRSLKLCACIAGSVGNWGTGAEALFAMFAKNLSRKINISYHRAHSMIFQYLSVSLMRGIARVLLRNSFAASSSDFHDLAPAPLASVAVLQRLQALQVAREVAAEPTQATSTDAPGVPVNPSAQHAPFHRLASFRSDRPDLAPLRRPASRRAPMPAHVYGAAAAYQASQSSQQLDTGALLAQFAELAAAIPVNPELEAVNGPGPAMHQPLLRPQQQLQQPAVVVGADSCLEPQQQRGLATLAVLTPVSAGALPTGASPVVVDSVRRHLMFEDAAAEEEDEEIAEGSQAISVALRGVAWLLGASQPRATTGLSGTAGSPASSPGSGGGGAVVGGGGRTGEGSVGPSGPML
jgi:hypothetical protein